MQDVNNKGNWGVGGGDDGSFVLSALFFFFFKPINFLKVKRNHLATNVRVYFQILNCHWYICLTLW